MVRDRLACQSIAELVVSIRIDAAKNRQDQMIRGQVWMLEKCRFVRRLCQEPIHGVAFRNPLREVAASEAGQELARRAPPGQRSAKSSSGLTHHEGAPVRR